jgi:UDP-4-amino-4,6-dideoxy-N-acetyl-beta-L-altrosamine transaminase
MGCADLLRSMSTQPFQYSKMSSIPYGRQEITEEDISAVVEILRSDYLTQGPTIKQFEDAFAAYVGAKYAVAVANGTAALHLSAIALGVKPGHKIITTPITFAATANCVRYCGGDIVFADIDRETYLLDIRKVRELLESAPRGTYHGIVPVDFSGRAVDLQQYRELADEHNLWIIEDACHAPGGFFTDRSGTIQRCGNGRFADLAIFSFHPVKHIATGEGGMITTNNEDLYRKVLMLRTHGITREPALFKNSIDLAFGGTHEEDDTHSSFPGWYMEMQLLGYNYRITDFQAALGISQLARAGKGLIRRQQIANKYMERLSENILRQPNLIDGHAYHLYVIEVSNRIGLYNHLRSKNIFSQVHYFPCHLMPYYRQFGWQMGDLPQAESYYRHCLSLPIYPSLSTHEQDFVIEELNSFLK